MNDLPTPRGGATNGDGDSIVLSRAEYEALVDRLEEAEARAAYQRTRDEESLPDAMLDRLLAGESPVRVWRLHRGLAALDLARRAGISKSYLSEIETAGKTGSVAVLKRISEVLGTELDDLV